MGKLNLKLMVLVFGLIGLAGCNEEAHCNGHGKDDVACGKAYEPTTPAAPVAPTPTPVTITVHSGVNFDCFAYDKTLWCRGGDIGSNGVEFQYADFTPIAHSDSAITAVGTWSYTICYEASVSERPVHGDSGVATYCRGRAELGDNVVGVDFLTHTDLPIQYGSSDLDWFKAPFLAAETSLAQLMVPGMNGLMIDGDAGASSAQINCTTLNGILTCPDFEIDLN